MTRQPLTGWQPGDARWPTDEALAAWLEETGRLTGRALQNLRAEARRAGVSLYRQLLWSGAVDALALLEGLHRRWGVPIVAPQREPWPAPALPRVWAAEDLAAHGVYPWAWDAARQTLIWAVGEPPEGAQREWLEAQGRAAVGPDARWEWVLALPSAIDAALLQHFREPLLEKAVLGLWQRHPHASAHTVATPGQFAGFALLVVGLVLGLIWAPYATALLLNAGVNIAFLANTVFKVSASLWGTRCERGCRLPLPPRAQAERAGVYPLYTVLIPVYKEAEVLLGLVRHLNAMTYPAAQTEIFLLLEEDDHETIAAARSLHLPERFRLLIVPNALPKTKPKACNVGLLFARGQYLVIYDAEDRPEPDQLSKAARMFAAYDERLLCLQAALNYYNWSENLLTRLFTLEYSYWFDYMLPGLSQMRMPIPLGGTSNHFRTELLRALGGWDPFNVTEDADLGIRAAAFGYWVGLLPSTTYEEANSRLGNWLRQRSRWIKGYMQTALVHARRPRALLRALGWRGLIGFLFLIAGTPLTLLATPWLWGLFGYWVWTQTHALDPFFPPWLLRISLLNLLAGNGLIMYLNLLAVYKRRYYALTPYALLAPFYWLLQSVAAYKAFWQLLTKPFYWEKTQHGISRFTFETAWLPHGRPRDEALHE